MSMPDKHAEHKVKLYSKLIQGPAIRPLLMQPLSLVATKNSEENGLVFQTQGCLVFWLLGKMFARKVCALHTVTGSYKVHGLPSIEIQLS